MQNKKFIPALLILRLLASAAVGGCVLGMWTLAKVPRTYESSASIVFPIASDDRGLASTGLLRNLMSAGTELPFGSQFPINTYRALLLSRIGMESAARQTGLHQRYKLSTPQDIAGFMSTAVDIDVSVDRMLIVTVTLPGTPRIRSLSDLTSPSDAKQRDAAVRRLAPQVVDALIAQMGKIADDVKLDSSKATVEALRRNLDELKERRQALLASVAARQQAADAPDADAMAKELTGAVMAYEGVVSQLSSEVEGLHSQRQADQVQVAALLRRLPMLSGDIPLLQEQRSAYVESRTKYDELSRMYGSDNAEVLKAKGKMDAAKSVMDDSITVAKQGFTQNILMIDSQLANLTAKKQISEKYLQALRARMRQLPSQLVALASEQAEANALADSMGDLAQQLQRAEVTYETQGMRWRVLDPPIEPVRKSSPRTMKTALLGALVGMVLLNLGLWASLYRKLLVLLSGDNQDNDDGPAT